MDVYKYPDALSGMSFKGFKVIKHINNIKPRLIESKWECKCEKMW